MDIERSMRRITFHVAWLRFVAGFATGISVYGFVLWDVATTLIPSLIVFIAAGCLSLLGVEYQRLRQKQLQSYAEDERTLIVLKNCLRSASPGSRQQVLLPPVVRQAKHCLALFDEQQRLHREHVLKGELPYTDTYRLAQLRENIRIAKETYWGMVSLIHSLDESLPETIAEVAALDSQLAGSV